jgi:MFS family permease
VNGSRKAPPVGTIALLTSLYFVQGMPFGFQSSLGMFMRELGVSLQNVTLVGALSLPWLLKPLWAPLVDKLGNPRFGRRKSWIVPLQLLLALACVAAAFSPPDSSLPQLLSIVFVMNLLAATQDIGVDAFAVDTLRPQDLGLGNAAQVVGYKLGMLVGGGALVALMGLIGWQGMFFAMAALCIAVMLVLTFTPERPAGNTASGEAPPSWREIGQRVRAALKLDGALWLLLFVATYKVGEEIATTLFKVFLVDRGVPVETAALWLGTWVMIASLSGSLFGGLIASRMKLVEAVGWTAGLRVLPLLGLWAIVAGLLPITASSVIGVASVEHFFAGALTTCMFALMMSQVDKRIGGTHYTFLAAVEVLGKTPAGLASGKIAQVLGYPAAFMVAVLASVGFLALVWPMRRRFATSSASS